MWANARNQCIAMPHVPVHRSSAAPTITDGGPSIPLGSPSLGAPQESDRLCFSCAVITPCVITEPLAWVWHQPRVRYCAISNVSGLSKAKTCFGSAS